MGRLKTGEIIKFLAIDDFTGKKTELIGKILGDFVKVREFYPVECGEAREGCFLVKETGRSNRLFVVNDYEIISGDNQKEEAVTSKPELKLVGLDGNAFFILGRAKRVAEVAGWSKDKIECFLTEAKSGNYDNLLATCMKYFDVI